MRLLAILVFFASIGSAYACSVPPAGLFESYHSLVRSTDTIVLAKAISHEDQQGRSLSLVNFEVVRILKGSSNDQLQIAGYVSSDEMYEPNDFDSHLDPAFWAFFEANSSTPGDCQAYGIFFVGEQYLLFLREQSHFQGFENIRTEDDLWLKVVERLVAGQ